MVVTLQALPPKSVLFKESIPCSWTLKGDLAPRCQCVPNVWAQMHMTLCSVSSPEALEVMIALFLQVEKVEGNPRLSLLVVPGRVVGNTNIRE